MIIFCFKFLYEYIMLSDSTYKENFNKSLKLQLLMCDIFSYFDVFLLSFLD